MPRASRGRSRRLPALPAQTDPSRPGTSERGRRTYGATDNIILTGNLNQKELTLSYLDKDPQPGAGYYYVRVIQDNREIAWGSPIWVKFQPEQ